MRRLVLATLTAALVAAGCSNDVADVAAASGANPDTTSAGVDVGQSANVDSSTDPGADVGSPGSTTVATDESNQSSDQPVATDDVEVAGFALASWPLAGTEATSGEIEISVTDYGAAPDDDRSDSAAFAAAVSAAGDIAGPVTITVDTGTYLLTDTLELETDITLRGQGPTSRLVLDFGDEEGPGIAAEGEPAAGWLSLAEPPTRNSTELVLGSTSAAGSFAPGDIIELQQTNDDTFYMRPDWRVDWGAGATGEMNRVASVSGVVVNLEAPLNADYRSELSPIVRRVDAVERVGVENLAVHRQDDGYGTSIRFEFAADVWVDDVVTTRTSRAHVGMSQTFGCRVSDSTLHDANDFGDGGRAYGVSLARHATGCLVTNNTLYDLRHAIIVQLGASGNVVAYNHARGSAGYEDRQPRADLSLHGHLAQGNLFEGNIVDRAVSSDWWGPSGPTNTLFRNCVRDHVILTNRSDGQIIAGNVIGRGGLTVDEDIEDTVLAGNFILSVEAASEGLERPPSINGPASLWTEDAPNFLEGYGWPPIDPSRNGSACDLPASERSPIGNE